MGARTFTPIALCLIVGALLPGPAPASPAPTSPAPASPCPPSAAPTTAPDAAIAQQRVRAGLDAALDGRRAEAVAEWAVALAHTPWDDPEQAAVGRTVMWKRAALLGALGRLAEAHALYGCYRERAPDDDPRRAEVDARMAELRALDPATLDVRTTPPGATVVIDAEPVGQTPWEGRLPWGPHQVKLTLDGHAPVEQDIALEHGARSELSVELPLLAPPAPVSEAPTPATETREPNGITAATQNAAPPGVEPEPGWDARTIGLVSGGALTVTGLALAGVGTAAYIEAEASDAPVERVRPLRDRAETYWRAGGVVTAIGVGVVVWALLGTASPEAPPVEGSALTPGGWAIRF